jgi:uncharacterized protein (DUF697 family)
VVRGTFSPARGWWPAVVARLARTLGIKINILFMELTSYESEQLVEIRKWKAEEPSVLSYAFGLVISPLTWLLNKIIPVAAIRGALDFSSTAAEWLTDTKDIAREAKVNDIQELKTLNLRTSDELANSVHNWAIGVATAEGGAAGATGPVGLTVDIPIIVTIALRTIHKIGICYGYEIKSKSDKEFVLSILSAASANDMQQKTLALMTLRSIEIMIMKQSWKTLAQQAGTQTVGREAGILAVKALAKQLGINLTKRKALQAIPIVGAAVGASVNGWYIKEVGWAARRAFQERWLAENNKLNGPIDA